MYNNNANPRRKYSCLIYKTTYYKTNVFSTQNYKIKHFFILNAQRFENKCCCENNSNLKISNSRSSAHTCTIIWGKVSTLKMKWKATTIRLMTDSLIYFFTDKCIIRHNCWKQSFVSLKLLAVKQASLLFNLMTYSARCLKNKKSKVVKHRDIVHMEKSYQYKFDDYFIHKHTSKSKCDFIIIKEIINW